MTSDRRLGSGLDAERFGIFDDESDDRLTNEEMQEIAALGFSDEERTLLWGPRAAPQDKSYTSYAIRLGSEKMPLLVDEAHLTLPDASALLFWCSRLHDSVMSLGSTSTPMPRVDRLMCYSGAARVVAEARPDVLLNFVDEPVMAASNIARFVTNWYLMLHIDQGHKDVIRAFLHEASHRDHGCLTLPVLAPAICRIPATWGIETELRSVIDRYSPDRAQVAQLGTFAAMIAYVSLFDRMTRSQT